MSPNIFCSAIAQGSDIDMPPWYSPQGPRRVAPRTAETASFSRSPTLAGTQAGIPGEQLKASASPPSTRGQVTPNPSSRQAAASPPKISPPKLQTDKLHRQPIGAANMKASYSDRPAPSAGGAVASSARLPAISGRTHRPRGTTSARSYRTGWETKSLSTAEAVRKQLQTAEDDVMMLPFFFHWKNYSALKQIGRSYAPPRRFREEHAENSTRVEGAWGPRGSRGREATRVVVKEKKGLLRCGVAW